MNHWNGGGVAIADLNNDKLPDIVFTGNQVGIRIYRNKGKLKFQDVTPKHLIDSLKNFWLSGVSAADVDNDGFKDIYVCRRAGKNTPNLLLKNLGSFEFKEISKHVGLIDNAYSTHAIFNDFDKDGDLDVYVINNEEQASNAHIISLKRATRKSKDLLFFQDGGQFVNVSDSLLTERNRQQLGLAACDVDVNWDGHTEIFVCNDLISEDRLLRTDLDKGKWSNEIKQHFPHTSANSMGCAVGDLNNDLWPDLLVLDMLANNDSVRKIRPERNVNTAVMTANANNTFQLMKNTLHINQFGSVFSEISMLSNLDATDWSWAPLIADFNNDGIKDVFVTTSLKRDILHMDYIRYYANEMSNMNPRLRYRASEMLKLIDKLPSVILRNELFLGTNTGEFNNISLECEDFLVNSNGAAYGDLDLDGDLDIVVNNLDTTSSILENVSSKSKNTNFIEFSFSSDFPPYLLYGTKGILFADGNNQYSNVSSAQGFQSTSEPLLHFGLGKNSVIDSVLLYYPNFQMTSIRKPKLNSRVEIVPSMLNGTTVWNGTPDFILPEFNVRHPQLPKRLQHQSKFRYDFGSKLNRLNLKGPKIKFPYASQYTDPQTGNQYLHIVSRQGTFGDIYSVHSKNDSLQFDHLANLDSSFLHAVGDKPRYIVENSIFGNFDGDTDLDLLVTGSNVPRLDSSAFYNHYLISNLLNPKVNLFKNDYHRTSTLDIVSCDNDLKLMINGKAPYLENYPKGGPTQSLLIDKSGGIRKNSGYKQFDGVVAIETFDLNNDGSEEVLIARENQELAVIDGLSKCEKPKFMNNTGLEGISGWWQCIKATDIDSDGDEDLIIGNFGRNWLPDISMEKPLKIFDGDIDGNGKSDPVILHYANGKYYPLQSRDDLLHQVTSLKKSYTTYSSYAESNYTEYISEADSSLFLEVNEFRNLVAINDNGYLNLEPLPFETEFGTVNHIFVSDYNLDGVKDLLFFGNSNHLNSTYGMPDGNTGIIVEGAMVKDKWKSKKIHHLGVKGVVTSALEFDLSGKPIYFLTFNNRAPLLIEIERHE